MPLTDTFSSFEQFLDNPFNNEKYDVENEEDEFFDKKQQKFNNYGIPLTNVNEKPTPADNIKSYINIVSQNIKKHVFTINSIDNVFIFNSSTTKLLDELQKYIVKNYVGQHYSASNKMSNEEILNEAQTELITNTPEFAESWELITKANNQNINIELRDAFFANWFFKFWFPIFQNKVYRNKDNNFQNIICDSKMNITILSEKNSKKYLTNTPTCEIIID